MSESRLRNLSKQQLIDFITLKGTEYKNRQCEIAYVATKDSQDQVPQLMESIRHAIQIKQAKIASLDQQKKNFNIEVSGLEIAQEALKAKLKKRKGQLHDSELEVKTIREKLNEIQKRVTPDTIKNLNKQIQNSDTPKLTQMLQSFTALVLNKMDPSKDDILRTIQSHSHCIETMVGALQISFNSDSEIANRHKETLRDVQKAFTDSTQTDNKACQPYSALLAWAQNYPFYIQHITQLLKLNQDLIKANKELEQKVEKTQNIKAVLAQIDANIDLLQKSIAEDNDRLAHYQQIDGEMHERVRTEQANFANFDKIFFSELEQFVIKKKMAASIKGMRQ